MLSLMFSYRRFSNPLFISVAPITSYLTKSKQSKSYINYNYNQNLNSYSNSFYNHNLNPCLRFHMSSAHPLPFETLHIATFCISPCAIHSSLWFIVQHIFLGLASIPRCLSNVLPQVISLICLELVHSCAWIVSCIQSTSCCVSKQLVVCIFMQLECILSPLLACTSRSHPCQGNMLTHPSCCCYEMMPWPSPLLVQRIMALLSWLLIFVHNVSCPSHLGVSLKPSYVQSVCPWGP